VLEQKQHTIDILSIDIHCASQDSLQFAPKGQRSRNSSAQAIKQELLPDADICSGLPG
tara:strand:+ start:101 stop:274 length:174 start_codon:yes stop_codon:yes gene_type:complete